MKIGFRILVLLVAIIIAAIVLAGCASGPASPSGASSANLAALSNNASFQWPDALHFAATGSSGETKMVSWATVLQRDLKGPVVRVVNEAAWTNTYLDMAKNKMVLSQIDNAALSDCELALNEYAMADGGPWMAGLVWVDSLANTGFLVREDSAIYKPEDIQPGAKIAIWNDKSATLSPFRSLLAWGNINEKDIVWVNTGSYDAGPRAVVEGRADICMAAPVSPSVMEALSAPCGIRYISLNPRDNPEGARRFLQNSPLYNFGPITVGPKSVQGTWAITSYKFLGANLSTDTALVYNLVKWLDQKYDLYRDAYESNRNMTLQDVLAALQTTYIPVHPGLKTYLEEKGVWNPDYEKRNQNNIALLQQYVSGYQDAMKQATAQKIEIKANNQDWIKFWENYKLAHKIPVIQMHVNLTQDAPVKLSAGYIPPGTSPASSPAPGSTPAASAAMEVPLEVKSISDAHPGSDVAASVKTVPGAEVHILFTMPNGSNSAYPQDNTKVAGADGIVTWTWNINSRVPAGEATYTFTAALNGKQSQLVVKKKI